MKKINSSLCSGIVLLACFFSLQTVFAVDVPLKKDPIGTGTMRMTRSVSTISTSVTADLDGSDLTINFNPSIGIAYVSIEDSTGNPVYQTAIDTSETPELLIGLGSLNSDEYTLVISYGTTKLTGTFTL